MAKKRAMIPPAAHKQQKKVVLPKIGVSVFTGTPDGKKAVLQIGIHNAAPETLHKNFRNDGWHVVSVDTHEDQKPNYVGSITQLSMIGDQSVDAVWCPHVMQKLFAFQIPMALKEACRVLKYNGVFYMTVPDAQIASAYFAHNRATETLYHSPAGPVTPMDLLFGFQPVIQRGNTSLTHHCAFTSESLATLMRESGFSNVQIKRDNYELQVMAIRQADDDPKRVERTTIVQNNKMVELENMPIVPPIPVAQASQAGYRSNPKMIVDEMDQPPFHPFSVSL